MPLPLVYILVSCFASVLSSINVCTGEKDRVTNMPILELFRCIQKCCWGGLLTDAGKNRRDCRQFNERHILLLKQIKIILKIFDFDIGFIYLLLVLIDICLV